MSLLAGTKNTITGIHLKNSFLHGRLRTLKKIGISPDIHNINFCSHFSFVVVNLVILRPFSSDLSPG